MENATPTATTPSSLKTPRHDLMMMEGKSRHTFFKQTKSYPMFPCHEEKGKWDDYGEPIRWVKRLFSDGLLVWVWFPSRPEDYVVKELVVPEEKEVC